MSGLIVHEWVEKSGGAEKVVQEFISEYPDAELQVLWTDAPERFATTATETWLARTPLRRSKAVALPLLPVVWRTLKSATRPEWMLVSSHLFAHHAKLRDFPEVPKLVYAHTPARYIWEPELDARGRSLPARVVSGMLKPLDRKRAQESIALAANSEFTRQRIARTWMRDATVIYPPVDTERIASVESWRDLLGVNDEEVLCSLPTTFVLGASRFVTYKRLDLVISCGEANDVPVVLAGGGPDLERLRCRAQEATVPVHFIDRPSDELLFALYQQSLAFIFPAIEDFGIMPVEAMAAGTPVVVPAVGGAAESVHKLAGGAIFERDSPDEWRSAIDLAQHVDREDLRPRTGFFSSSAFRGRIREWVNTSTRSS